MGPLYIKVGQILATRPDFVSEATRDELARLNDRVEEQPFEEFEPVLAEELGEDWRSIFSSVETRQPLGTASLAQVYSATLHDGTPCVIKVQRPEAGEAVRGDMRVLRRTVGWIARMTPRFSEVVDLPAMVDLLFDVMRDELDFTREAANMKKARKATKAYKRISVPKVLLAKPRVLVQTLAEGVAINRLEVDQLTRKQRKRLAEELMDFMLRSYLISGRFHADPHPGNILVSPSGKAHIIDWGMVGKIDRSTQHAVLGIFLGLAANDGEIAAANWISLGYPTRRAQVRGFARDVSRVIPRWSHSTLGELNYGVALLGVLKSSTRRRIQTAPVISILGKSLANMEGSVRFIYPDLKLSKSIAGTLEDVTRHVLASSFSQELNAARLVGLLRAGEKGGLQGQSLLDELSSGGVRVQARGGS
ncbi:AarF/ABC1/UbiB kinase family protein [Streptomyces sp. NPDC049970]|uniref:ABC1 kinase family protein n=1 Tax=Streptomyces sp. NPDC049970 TaxID=3155033 RepID=UPI00343463BD